jgi:putative acetyltransferase
MIRAETPDDTKDIRRVIVAAFGRAEEATLVEQLRAAGDLVVSLVAVDGPRLIGHVAFSRMSAPFRALGLGPVAVDPKHQRRGIGERLIREGLSCAKSGAFDGIFVLGDPRYYQRFGFAATRAAGFSSPYAGPHFMALELSIPLPVLDGSVEYAPAFGRLSEVDESAH